MAASLRDEVNSVKYLVGDAFADNVSGEAAERAFAELGSSRDMVLSVRLHVAAEIGVDTFWDRLRNISWDIFL